MAEPFTLQLHITDACPLRCRHCYRDQAHAALPLVALRRILDDFTAFCQRRALPARVTFAGGEPLVRYDDLLKLSRQARDAGHQVHLLTNGLLLTREKIEQLRAAGCLRVQISLDGDEPAHDALRGSGTFARAVEALDVLRSARFPATISMTLGEWNLPSLGTIIELARRCAAKLFVSRFVPCGAGLALREQVLTDRQWLDVMRICHRAMRHHAPGAALRDPLYIFMLERDHPTHSLCVGGCAIGYGGLAVESDGTAYPCRRLPLPLGNMIRTSLEDLWTHPLLEQLRDRDQLKGRCGQCRWRWKCGGCRAIAHALAADPLAEDPQCPWRRPGLLHSLRAAVAPVTGRMPPSCNLHIARPTSLTS